MQVIVNGEKREISDMATLADYLAQLNVSAQLVVIELNGEIISREQFATRMLNDGDVVEIVQMMAGG